MVGWDQLYLRKTKSQTSVSKWPTSPEKTKRKLSWKQSLTDFCRESSIHGIKYLVESDQHWMEKVFWVVSLAFGKIPICHLLSHQISSAIWFQFILLYPLMEKFLKTKTITSILTTNHPISEIDFPGITICSNTRVSKSRYDAAMKNSKLPWKNLTEKYGVNVVGQVVSNLVMFNLHPGLNFSDDSLIYKNYSEYLTGLMAAVV